MGNMQNEKIPDIGSLGFGQSTGAGSNTGKPSGKSGIKLSAKQLMVLGGAAVALVVIVIIGLLLTGGSAERKVERVVKDYFAAWISFDWGDVSWDKYYPDEIAEGLMEDMKKMEKEMKEEVPELEGAEIEVLSISRLDRKYDDMLEDIVMEYADELGVSLKKKDLDISKGYVVTLINPNLDEGYYSINNVPQCFFVIKVNGRYGVYMYL